MVGGHGRDHPPQAEAARHFLEELQTDLLPAENLDSEELQRRLRLFEKVLEEFDRFSIEISVDNKNANEMTDEIQLFRNNMQQKLTKAGRSLAR